MRPSLCPASSCSMSSFTLAAMTSLLVCGLGSVGRVATLALTPLFMVALLSLGSGFCLCRNGIAASICRTPPGEGGGSKVQGEGSPHPWRAGAAGTKRAKRSGGLHKRSAEDWGSPCGARSGQSPLAGLFSLALRAAHGLIATCFGRLLRRNRLEGESV